MYRSLFYSIRSFVKPYLYFFPPPFALINFRLQRLFFIKTQAILCLPQSNLGNEFEAKSNIRLFDDENERGRNWAKNIQLAHKKHSTCSLKL